MPSDPRESLRGDDHAQVLAVAALRPAAVLGRHRQTEGAHVGQAGDDALGNVTVGAVDVFGDWRDLLVGEGPETVLHQLEVRIEVARARHRGQFGLEVRTPVAGEEVAYPGQRGVVLQPPHGLAPDETAPEVVQRLGDEGAREAGLDVALRRTRASSAPSPPPPRRGPGRRRATGGPPAHRPRPAGARPARRRAARDRWRPRPPPGPGESWALTLPSGSHLGGPTAVGRCVASGAAALPGVALGKAPARAATVRVLRSNAGRRPGSRTRRRGSVTRWPARASASCAVAATSGSWARSPTPCSTPEARSPASSLSSSNRRRWPTAG